jgi:hypothetical protein
MIYRIRRIPPAGLLKPNLSCAARLSGRGLSSLSMNTQRIDGGASEITLKNQLFGGGRSRSKEGHLKKN